MLGLIWFQTLRRLWLLGKRTIRRHFFNIFLSRGITFNSLPLSADSVLELYTMFRILRYSGFLVLESLGIIFGENYFIQIQANMRNEVHNIMRFLFRNLLCSRLSKAVKTINYCDHIRLMKFPGYTTRPHKEKITWLQKFSMSRLSDIRLILAEKWERMARKLVSGCQTETARDQGEILENMKSTTLIVPQALGTIKIKNIIFTFLFINVQTASSKYNIFTKEHWTVYPVVSVWMNQVKIKVFPILT